MNRAPRPLEGARIVKVIYATPLQRGKIHLEERKKENFHSFECFEPPMNLQQFFKTLGPGILFASTAIGVSHLVQSTRAGADYGFALLWAVIAANVFKFPFFEYGSRYASGAGESLIDGYRRMGKWMLWIYFFVTLGSMFFVAAAVNAVAAGFFDNLFGISALTPGFTLTPVVLLLAICLGILLWGQFKLLDSVIKVFGTVLLVTTVTAFFLTLARGPSEPVAGFVPPELWTTGGVAFLIALMGWMPTAVDLSTWNSLWTLERIKSSGYRPTLRQTLGEFNLGYWISAGLSICFVTLGAYLIYGTGTEMPASSAAFSKAVVSLYTKAMGNWSQYLIGTAALSIMFGTSIGVLDGYARAMERTVELLNPNLLVTRGLSQRAVYNVTLVVVTLGAFALIAWFSGQLKALVDLATTLSFLIAPLIAIVNFRLVSRKEFPAEARPGMGMRLLSYAGILFLTGFGVYYLWEMTIGNQSLG